MRPFFVSLAGGVTGLGVSALAAGMLLRDPWADAPTTTGALLSGLLVSWAVQTWISVPLGRAVAAPGARPTRPRGGRALAE